MHSPPCGICIYILGQALDFCNFPHLRRHHKGVTTRFASQAEGKNLREMFTQSSGFGAPLDRRHSEALNDACLGNAAGSSCRRCPACFGPSNRKQAGWRFHHRHLAFLHNQEIWVCLRMVFTPKSSCFGGKS